MKRNDAALTLRDVLRRRGVLYSTCADLEERAHVAIRFGLLRGVVARQQTADVQYIGHRKQRAWPSAKRQQRAA